MVVSIHLYQRNNGADFFARLDIRIPDCITQHAWLDFARTKRMNLTEPTRHPGFDSPMIVLRLALMISSRFNHAALINQNFIPCKNLS